MHKLHKTDLLHFRVSLQRDSHLTSVSCFWRFLKRSMDDDEITNGNFGPLSSLSSLSPFLKLVCCSLSLCLSLYLSLCLSISLLTSALFSFLSLQSFFLKLFFSSRFLLLFFTKARRTAAAATATITLRSRLPPSNKFKVKETTQRKRKRCCC